jgi:cohesin loading factor subunit SCC2
MGLQAACVVLLIAVCSGVDRRAVNEDAIEAAITLYRSHLSKHIVPAWNQTGHMLHIKSLDEKAGLASPSKKRRLSTDENYSSASSGLVKDLKKVYKHIACTVRLQLTLTERLELLIRKVPLDDQQILMLTNGSLIGLEIDCGAPKLGTFAKDSPPPPQQLQLACVNLVSSAFRTYPSHRDTILEDVFPLMLRLPTGKKSLRALGVNYGSASSPTTLAALNATLVDVTNTQPNIQTITYLILSCIQACVVRPVLDTSDDSPQGQIVSGLKACRAVSEVFVSQLLKRCSRTKDGALEYRPILANIVEDLLQLTLIPQFPAAELVLVCISQRLNQELSAASSSAKTKSHFPPEPTFLTIAFDILGKVMAYQARVLATSRSKPLAIATTIENEPTILQNEVHEVHLACHCGDTRADALMIQCDHCRTASHCSCVGVAPDDIPEEWFCDGCRLGRIALRERRQLGVEAATGIVDEVFTYRHSFLSRLSHRIGVAELVDATQFHLSRWVDEIERNSRSTIDQQATFRQLVQELLTRWEAPVGALGPGTDSLTEEGSSRITLHLLARTSPLCLSFRHQVSLILKLMADESVPMLRKLAVKTIEKVADGDPQLMLLPIVTKAVSRRLTDDSISVREATVSLVGAYVVQFPAVANAFHSSLLDCLVDVGVSVRKRAVRIFQEILISNPRYRGRSSVCDSMITRAIDPKEEDGVRDLIFELFTKLWLEYDDDVITSPTVPLPKPASIPSSPDGNTRALLLEGFALGSSVVTPTPPALSERYKHSRSSQKRVDIAAEQMMEVVRASGSGERLHSLIVELLAGSNNARACKSSERKQRSALDQKQCSCLVESLFELLLQVEEQRSIRTSRVGKDVAATLQTIAVFANLAPNSVFEHFDTIGPYLKADNGVSFDDESKIVGAVCDIIVCLSPNLKYENIQQMASGTLAKDIVLVIYKFGSSALGSAIKALSSLGHHPDGDENSVFRKKLLEMARTFYCYLLRKETVEDFSNTDDKTRSNTHRALTVLGLVCRYHERPYGVTEEESEVDDSVAEISSSELTYANLIVGCYRIFSTYLQTLDAPTKCSALRALGGLFVSQPRLMLELEQVGLIEHVMSEESHISLQLESLQCWKTILLAEERRIDGGVATEKLEKNERVTLSNRISGDQDGDATLFGGVLTNHANRLFEMSQSKDRRVRYAALDLIGLLLRQGLVNPNECIPFLFALQGDVENAAIRSLALHLLMKEGERRPDALRQRICVGAKQAYDFQRRIYSQKDAASALITVRRGRVQGTECIFGSVFRNCISKSQKQRRGLFKNLLSFFETAEVNVETPFAKNVLKISGGGQANGSDLSLLSFTSQILAYLPYAAASDPLFIIHHIGSIVTIQGTQIVDAFAALLRPAGLASNDEYDEANVTEDALEKVARSKFPSRTQEASALSKIDQLKFLHLCRRGAAIVLLLRLKAHLRRSYNLSEFRCLEYDPNAKDRIAEKGISKVDNSPPFDASVPADLIHSSDSFIHWDTMIREYAEFRQLMRKENSFDIPMGEVSDEQRIFEEVVD